MRATISWLDVKLGLRMVLRYPGMAVVGTLAMAVGIGLAAGYLEVANDFLHPTLPLEDGDRFVAIRNWDAETNTQEFRSLHDFGRWRGELRTIEELGAFRTVERNLILGEGAGEPVEVAEITPSGFRLAGVSAEIGRTLTDRDAQPGGRPVVVIGHKVWENRFRSDPDVLGRTVRLGEQTYTVGGVMPEGFAFPVSHRFWIPFRFDPLDFGPREGPGIQVFGLLAEGATMEEARAELTAIGQRMAGDLPETHAHLRPRVVPYPELFFGGGGGSEFYLIELVFVMLLVLMCANVATLVFARTATRRGEIAVRNALGASRIRVIGQLFVEALVLSLAAAVVGLAVVSWGMRQVMDLFWTAMGGRAPFWWDGGLSATTIGYAVVLAVVAAFLVGVVPALKGTRVQIQERLQNASGGGSGLQLGTMWTVLLVAQVAFSVAILPPAMALVDAWVRSQRADPGFAAEEFLSAHLEMNGELPEPVGEGADNGDPGSGAFEATYQELARQVAAAPGVLDVTFAEQLPGMSHPSRRIEVEGEQAPGRLGPEVDGSEPDQEVDVATVAPDFFDVVGAEIRAGRTFHSGDASAGARTVVVNRSFAERILEGRNAVGRRVRYRPESTTAEPGPWYEIVGVVENLAMDTQGLTMGTPAGLYHPLTEADLVSGEGSWGIHMAVHVRDDPTSFAPRLRRIATELDPTLRLSNLTPLDRPGALTRAVQVINKLIVWVIAFVSLIAFLISASGTYSLMSFTVARRTREIGIRAALGATRWEILVSVFSRVLRQLGLGVILGTLVLVIPVVAMGGARSGGDVGWDTLWMFLPVAGVIVLVALVACGVPVRRALRVQPTEALRHIS